MSEDFTIRMGSRIDIAALAKLQVNGWLTNLHKKPIELRLKRFFFGELKKRWKRRLEKNIKVLVLELKEEIKGFVAFYPFNKNSLMCAEVANIYVIPDLRRQGLGRRLCEAMLQFIDEAKIISVWILDSDCMTQMFYEKLGFRATKETRCDAVDHGMTLKEIHYQLVL